MSNRKKAFVIFGSPHKDGFTSKLLNCLLSELKSYDITFFYAYNKHINPCTACNNCQNNIKCIHNDDFKLVDAAFKTYDILIIATPIYNLNFPAPVKAILDRTQLYFSMRFAQNINPPINKKKSAILLLTSGSKCDKSIIKFISRQIKMVFSIINANLIGTILLDCTDYNNNLASIKPKIKKLANKLTNSK